MIYFFSSRREIRVWKERRCIGCVYRVQSQQYNIHTRKRLLLFHMQVAHRREERERESWCRCRCCTGGGTTLFDAIYAQAQRNNTTRIIFKFSKTAFFFLQDFHLLLLLWSQTEILRSSLKMSNLLFVLLHAFCCCCMIFFYYCWCCYYHYYDYSELP